jgi:ubiquitin carboxyl-terminal hydrolase 9/24
MNSVLQQLFMIEGIRNGILSAESACTDDDEDFSGEDRETEGQENNDPTVGGPGEDGVEQSRKEYNVTILKQVQAIFGHLACSKLQLYVPRGLWKHFRMLGEPVNLREQQVKNI